MQLSVGFEENNYAGSRIRPARRRAPGLIQALTLSPEWMIAGAVVLAVALFFSLRALGRQRHRNAEDAMQEQPWSPEALALLSEPLDGSDTAVPPEPEVQSAAVAELRDHPGVEPPAPAPQAAVEPPVPSRQTRVEAPEPEPVVEPPAPDPEPVVEPPAPEPEPSAGLPPTTEWLLTEIAATSRDSGTTTLGSDAAPPGGAANTAGPEVRGQVRAQRALRDVLYELPMRAGDAEIAAALREVAQSALGYYRYGLMQDSPSLPVGVSTGESNSTSSDTSVIAGYLDLELRLGRLPADLHPDKTASALLGAVAARALGMDRAPDMPDPEFVYAAVDILLNNRSPRPGATPKTSQVNGLLGSPAAGAREPLRWRSNRRA